MLRQTNEVLLISDVNPMSPTTESYRTLRTNTSFAAAGERMCVVGIASCFEGEGKTTTAANLAVTYAQEGKKTLLIDADLRKPSQHKTFSISSRKGLSTVLAKQSEFDQSIVPTHIEHLSLIPAGPIPPNPTELLASKRMDELLLQAREQFDVILIDTSPVLLVADALVIASKCDGVLLVVGAGKVKKSAAKRAKEKLEHVQAKLLGVVVNGQKKTAGDDSYYQYAITK